MTIDERSAGSVRVLDLAGQLSQGPDGSERLADKVRSLLQQGDRRVLLNLERVTYMDSAGLGALVQSFAAATRQGGHLKLVNATAKLQDLLAITKLATVFEMFDSETAALASFD